QKDVYSAFQHFLTQDDHIEALSNLLWHRKVSQADRVMEMVPEKYRNLFHARMKLIQSGAGLEAAIKRIPKELSKDPGLSYDCMTWRDKRKMDNAVRQMLKDAPDTVHFPEKWWKVREGHVWKLIDKTRYKEAHSLLKDHGQH